MSNTGRKIYQFLVQMDAVTGLPTGVRKANVVGDPDYVPPVLDYASCPVVTWQAINPFCITDISGNTGQKGFAKRIRITNGVPDGYQEDNTTSGGLGIYFPPVTDYVTCPLPEGPPPPPPPPVPSITQISNIISGSVRIQVFQIGSNVNIGNKFRLGVYSHDIFITAVAGDTATSIATKLKNAINATTATEWNDHSSAPSIGTAGFKPTATSSGSQITITLNIVNQFGSSASVS